MAQQFISTTEQRERCPVGTILRRTSSFRNHQFVAVKLDTSLWQVSGGNPDRPYNDFRSNVSEDWGAPEWEKVTPEALGPRRPKEGEEFASEEVDFSDFPIGTTLAFLPTTISDAHAVFVRVPHACHDWAQAEGSGHLKYVKRPPSDRQRYRVLRLGHEVKS